MQEPTTNNNAARDAGQKLTPEQLKSLERRGETIWQRAARINREYDAKQSTRQAAIDRMIARKLQAIARAI